MYIYMYYNHYHYRSRYTVIALTRRIMNESESESECLRNKKAARNIRHNFDTIGYFLAIVSCPCNAFAFGGRLIFDKQVDISSLCDHEMLMRLCIVLHGIIRSISSAKKILGWTIPLIAVGICE